MEQIKGKNILITGGAGSIGSEIVRQCLQYKPKQILIDKQKLLKKHTTNLIMCCVSKGIAKPH